MRYFFSFLYGVIYKDPPGNQIANWISFARLFFWLRYILKPHYGRSALSEDVI